MIDIKVFLKEDKIQSFEFYGHAEYADRGEDVVCGAISVLVINAINSIEAFTEDAFDCSTDEQDGRIHFQFTEDVSYESDLLMKSMLLGVEKTREEYGHDYIKLVIKEV